MRQTVELQFGSNSDNPDTKGSVFVYSHWDGGDDVNSSPLAEKVRAALAKHWCWGDESYLARIIISEIIRDEIESENNYGISPTAWYCDEEYPRIVVDLSCQTVNGILFEKFIKLYA